MKHVKPTQEELDAGIQKSLEEAEALKNQPKEVKEEKPIEKEPVQEEKEEFEVGEKEETQEEIDYKKKFIESTKESQVLNARNKKVFETLDKIEEVPEPTEDELRKEFPDWDVMTDFEKRIAKNDVVNGRKFQELGKMRKEFKDLEEWQGKVDTFIQDPNTFINFPQLEGKTDEFKLFASKPSRRGVDFEDLIRAFLFNESSLKKSNKGKMFETGNGGPKETPKPKSDKISIEEARTLRKTDYGKYTEYLRAGKIENDLT
jgi:hypothetical protein